MKIRTQDARQYIEYGEAFIQRHGSETGVYLRSRYQKVPVLAGVYEDEARGRGVLYEMGIAYKERESIYYMPAE